MQLPIKYVYLSIPLGMGLATIRGIQDLIKYFRSGFGKEEKK